MFQLRQRYKHINTVAKNFWWMKNILPFLSIYSLIFYSERLLSIIGSEGLDRILRGPNNILALISLKAKLNK